VRFELMTFKYTVFALSNFYIDFFNRHLLRTSCQDKKFSFAEKKTSFFTCLLSNVLDPINVNISSGEWGGGGAYNARIINVFSNLWSQYLSRICGLSGLLFVH